MKIKKFPLILVTIELILIVFGGFIYSLIPICNDKIENNIEINNCTFIKPSLSDSIFFVITTVTTIGKNDVHIK